MLRRILSSVILAVAVLSSTAVPAQAHTDVCVYEGNLFTFGGPLPAFTVGGGTTVEFLALPLLPCATGFGPFLGGLMTGSVFGTTTGTGSGGGGHAFAFSGVGGTLVLAGQITGVLVMTPHPLSTTGDMFLVHGSITLIH